MQQFLAELAVLRERFLVHAEMVKTRFGQIDRQFKGVATGLAETNRRLEELGRTMSELAQAFNAQTGLIEDLFVLVQSALARTADVERRVTSLETDLAARVAALEGRLPRDAA